MKPIKPIRVVRSTKDSVVSSESPSPISDTPEARAQYDPRLLDNNPLVEYTRHYPLMDFFDLSVDERTDEKINQKVKDVYTWLDRRFPKLDTPISVKALQLCTCLRKNHTPTSCFDVGCSAKTCLEDEFTFCSMNKE